MNYSYGQDSVESNSLTADADRRRGYVGGDRLLGVSCREWGGPEPKSWRGGEDKRIQCGRGGKQWRYGDSGMFYDKEDTECLKRLNPEIGEEDLELLDDVNVSAHFCSSLLKSNQKLPKSYLTNSCEDTSPSHSSTCHSSGFSDQPHRSRQTWRLVYKDGSCNVTSKNVSKRRKRYLIDIFTTLVDMKWRYSLAMFGAAFLFSWCFFSVLWWSTAMLNGDHNHVNETEWVPCVEGVYDFTTAFLYSIETQHTIGYGTRAIGTECPPAIFILMLQCCVGLFIHSLVTGLVFAKLSRPKGRARTLMFSRRAVICQRDGQYCLLFRLGDMRKSHIISTSIRALVVRNHTTREGEMIPLCQYNLKLETETDFSDGFVFLVSPVTVVHRIDETSPLYDVSAESLMCEHFEIIVILEGILEPTGNAAQFRTSYLPSEILWGQRLAPLFTYQKNNGQYEIDFTQFHSVVPVESMPSCSAREYREDFKDEPLSEKTVPPYPKNGCEKSAPSSVGRSRDKYFPAGFTVIASDTKVLSRHPSILKKKIFSRGKTSSLASATTDRLKRFQVNGDPEVTSSEPVIRRLKQDSTERTRSRSQDSYVPQKSKSDSGSPSYNSAVLNNVKPSASVNDTLVNKTPASLLANATKDGTMNIISPNYDQVDYIPSRFSTNQNQVNIGSRNSSANQTPHDETRRDSTANNRQDSNSTANNRQVNNSSRSSSSNNSLDNNASFTADSSNVRNGEKASESNIRSGLVNGYVRSCNDRTDSGSRVNVKGIL